MRHVWQSLFSRSAPPTSAPRSTLVSENSADAAHREIAALAVRDVLRKHGIPPAWITANPQWSAILRRQRGVHLQLMVREWHPQMLSFMPAIERSVRSRTLRLDPLAAQWLHAVSWKFDLVDDSPCPAMPHPRWWQAQLATATAGSGAAVTPVEGTRTRESADAPTEQGTDQAPAFLPTMPMVQ